MPAACGVSGQLPAEIFDSTAGGVGEVQTLALKVVGEAAPDGAVCWPNGREISRPMAVPNLMCASTSDPSYW